MTCDSSEYTVGPAAVMAPDDTIPVEIDLYDKCANVWRANEDVTTGEYLLPTVPSGFSYEATAGGRTGTREPLYPKTIGQMVATGSVTLTCRAASAGGINAITAPSAASDPTGLTISSPTVVESRKIQCTYSGTGLSDGQDYDVVFTFTLNGLTRTARHRVEVRVK